MNSNSRIISTDENPSLPIESSAIINLGGVSTKLNKYIVFTMQTYKKLITRAFIAWCRHAAAMFLTSPRWLTNCIGVQSPDILDRAQWFWSCILRWSRADWKVCLTTAGIEPTTLGIIAQCSATWATRPLCQVGLGMWYFGFESSLKSGWFKKNRHFPNLFPEHVNCSISIAFIPRLNFKLLFCVHSSKFGKCLLVKVHRIPSSDVKASFRS